MRGIGVIPFKSAPTLLWKNYLELVWDNFGGVETLYAEQPPPPPLIHAAASVKPLLDRTHVFGDKVLGNSVGALFWWEKD